MAAGTAAVGQIAITFLMDVEAMQARRQATDFGEHEQLVAGLGKGDDAINPVALRRHHWEVALAALPADMPPAQADSRPAATSAPTRMNFCIFDASTCL